MQMACHRGYTLLEHLQEGGVWQEGVLTPDTRHNMGVGRNGHHVRTAGHHVRFDYGLRVGVDWGQHCLEFRNSSHKLLSITRQNENMPERTLYKKQQLIVKRAKVITHIFIICSPLFC